MATGSKFRLYAERVGLVLLLLAGAFALSTLVEAAWDAYHCRRVAQAQQPTAAPSDSIQAVVLRLARCYRQTLTPDVPVRWHFVVSADTMWAGVTTAGPDETDSMTTTFELAWLRDDPARVPGTVRHEALHVLFTGLRQLGWAVSPPDETQIEEAVVQRLEPLVQWGDMERACAWRGP